MEAPPDNTAMFEPPGGSIFDSLTGKDGPPMARMIVIQGVCEMAGRAKMLNQKMKMGLVLLISLAFIAGDFKQFMQQRGANIYSKVGLHRASTLEEIDYALEQYN